MKTAKRRRFNRFTQLFALYNTHTFCHSFHQGSEVCLINAMCMWVCLCAFCNLWCNCTKISTLWPAVAYKKSLLFSPPNPMRPQLTVILYSQRCDKDLWLRMCQWQDSFGMAAVHLENKQRRCMGRNELSIKQGLRPAIWYLCFRWWERTFLCIIWDFILL